MELLTPMRNWLVGQLASRLDGGSVVFYDGTPFRRASNQLVRVALPAPAFGPPSGGTAVAQNIPPVLVELGGDIGWAQFVTVEGVPVANATVDDNPDNPDGADIRLSRLRVERGGEFTLQTVTLRLPATS